MPSAPARLRYPSMSRKGSTTSPTPRSGSATRKLAFPSSGARNASTVNTASSADGDRRGCQEDPDRDQRDGNRSAVEDHLRGDALGPGHAKVDEQVAQAVREKEERHSDQDQEVQLHDRVAQDAYPSVVVAVHHGHDAKRSENPLDEDVNRDQQRGQDASLREHEPPEEVHQGGPLFVCDFRAHLKGFPPPGPSPPPPSAQPPRLAGRCACALILQTRSAPRRSRSKPLPTGQTSQEPRAAAERAGPGPAGEGLLRPG